MYKLVDIDTVSVMTAGVEETQSKREAQELSRNYASDVIEQLL